MTSSDKSLISRVLNKWVDKKKKLWYIYTVEQQKNKEFLPFCNSMDGTGDYYAKWNKPVGERQIPYHLTYKWNLVNKIN